MAVVYGLEWEDKTHPVVDFNLLPFVYLCTSEEAHDVHLMPLELVLARVYRDNNATERVYEWLGEEGKRAWAESQARTKQLKELPLAKERYEVVMKPSEDGRLPASYFGRWLYEWASTANAEVMMEIYPQRDFRIPEWEVSGDATQNRRRVRLTDLMDMVGSQAGGCWSFDRVDGVLVVNNRLRFLDKDRVPPLASWKPIF